MLSREELKELRTAFWTAFGNLMRPHKSETDYNVRWTNYRTGVKDLYFRLDMDGKKATIAIDFQHPDDGIRQLFWEQFMEYRTYFESVTEGSWTYSDLEFSQEGKPYARIYRELYNVSLYQKNTWPTAFSFMKDNLLLVDSFWADVRLTFIELSK